MDDEIRNDINIFLDDNEVEERIIDMLNKTKNTNNEHGFLFAITENEIILSETIIGEEGIVDIEREVDYRDFYKFNKHGSIHTHPYNETKTFSGAIPSGTDISFSFLYDEYFFIIATVNKDDSYTLNAYSGPRLKELIPDIKEFLILINDEPTLKNVAKVLGTSMVYHPESWIEDTITRDYK